MITLRELILHAVGNGERDYFIICTVQDIWNSFCDYISYDTIKQEIDKIVADGDLIKIQYKIPEFSDRVYSIILPKGSTIVS